MKTVSKRKVTFPRHYLVTSSQVAPKRKQKTKMNSTETLDEDMILPIEPFLIRPPLLRDILDTVTSSLQDATVAECLPLLNGLNNPSENPFDYDEKGVKELDRESHIAFAEDALAPFPAPFVSIDASRPWMVYWALTALHFLGQDVKAYRARVVKTFVPHQNQAGGYGGGQGHSSHLAATYATLLSLALVGGPNAYELTDRRTMWEWLGRLKQADGGFRICEGGEKDTRAAYCALLVIALLNLPWELPPNAPARAAGLQSFGDGLGDYISRCQTYEGGLSSEPGTEAHGAYTFCALAALCLLDAPHISIPKHLDIDFLLAWLSSRQYAPEGGFAGRTNKVVDGCYSHWIGDCFPLVQAALTGPVQSTRDQDVGSLYSTEGLSRYVLNCCQNPNGGLRDKPSKGPDSYHTCYTLSGLSTAEHYHYYTSDETTQEDLSGNGKVKFDHVFAWKTIRNQDRRQRSQDTETPEEDQDGANKTAPAADARSLLGSGLNAVHPVFVIPHGAVLSMRQWSASQSTLV